MESNQQFCLQKNNSFNVRTICPTIHILNTKDDLAKLPELITDNFYILGEGSNTLFVEERAPLIIKPELKGIDVFESQDKHVVKIGAGENWHNLVETCLTRGIYGLENLALIPGSVGAAPVQNIGAYGVEFADFCTYVLWYDFASNQIKTLTNQDCRFRYRDSIFKNELYNKGIIIEVVMAFPKKWHANLSYAGLDVLAEDSSPIQIMEKVISLRQAKLPDPNILANAGSFFKNPVISMQQFKSLQKTFPDIPHYPQAENQTKLAAGWLIEQAGLKGYRERGVGVHQQQALVLVNYESTKGSDIVDLAALVQQRVFSKFAISITPEVRMVTANGEQDFAQLIKHK
ncbi:UDP-N-acetylmuramate dehydrogenase [Colwellia sp. KU-HH00111]|uniref:UDP-N-acetylmuramate dehydrogenase n=1 Tax=Colwellia sp. KU-HH00111 TaxID=3127652 RepID=UPI003365300D